MVKKNKKNKKTSKFRIFSKDSLIKIVVSFSALVILFGVYSLGIQSPVSETSFYRISSGATITAVAVDMRQKNLIGSETLFKVSVILQGNRIQSGIYEIKPRVSISRIAKMFNRGDIASTVIVIPEGLTVKQIKKQLLDNSTLVGSVECTGKLKKEVGVNSVCNLKDGDLFPDTYRVARGTSRLALLELSRNKMESINIGWENSGKAIPQPLKTWNEVITLASIIQKETPRVSEMPIVASVYLNRLKKR